ncbi:MAG: hypothetical protein P4L55_15480, partial [Syntrophobacteraceae bacterium]|nr:hypothetical protein [Syntrophobacteraceae bacterium]
MFHNLRGIVSCTIMALALSTIIFASTALSGQFERAPAVLQTSDVLHGTLIHSPNYTVRPTVVNDGFINTYYLDTNYGALRVESTALLLKRIGELNTIAKIEQLKKSNVY